MQIWTGSLTQWCAHSSFVGCWLLWLNACFGLIIYICQKSNQYSSFDHILMMLCVTGTGIQNSWPQKKRFHSCRPTSTKISSNINLAVRTNEGRRLQEQRRKEIECKSEHWRPVSTGFAYYTIVWAADCTNAKSHICVRDWGELWYD